MGCSICGHDLTRDGYNIVCTNCGCKAGTITTIELVDRQSAADMRNFYQLIMEIMELSVACGFVPDDKAKAQYHEVKALAEYYADLAGDTQSDEWKFADYFED